MSEQVRGLSVAAVVLVVAQLAAGCRSFEARYVDASRLSHGQDVGGVPVAIERDRWLKVTHTRVRFEVFVADAVADSVQPAAAAPPSEVGGIPIATNTSGPSAARTTEVRVRRA